MKSCPFRLFLALVIGLVFAPLPGRTAATAPDKSIDDYNFAAWLYNQGKYPMAADAYSAFLKAHASHEKAADARFGLAQAQFYQDKFREAADTYTALRTEAPTFPQLTEALFQLAQCRVALNDFADAEKLFGEVSQRAPEHYLADWARARQAACQISLEQYPSAEALLQTFVDAYAPGDKPASESPATRALIAKFDAAGIKAQDAFLGQVERSEFYLGVAQFNQSRFAEAQRTFERFLKRYPQSLLAEEAQLRLAQSRYQQKDYAGAVGAYRAATPGTNTFAEDAAFELGLALYKDGKIKDAATAFGEMHTHFPQSPRAASAAQYAGMFLFESGDYAGAEQRLRPLVDGKVAGADEAGYWLGMSLLKQGRAADAVVQFRGLLERAPSSSRAGDARLGLGDALLAQDQRVEAAKAFHQFAAEHPDAEQAPRALYSACVALHRAGNYAESDDACDAFLKRYAADSLAPQVVFLSGENRFLANAPDRAAARYTELLARQDVSKENASRAHFRLAWVAHEAKRDAEALNELNKVVPAEAGEVVATEARYLKGVCLADSGKPAEAAAALEDYWKHAGDRRYGEDALLRLAAAYTAAGKPAQAVEAYERFIKEFPKSELATQARYQQAESLFAAKQYDRAAKRYEEALASQPQGPLAPYAAFGIGLCRAEQGQSEKAAERFAAVVKEFPKSDLVPQARYRQARAKMALKQWGDAAEVLQELIKDTPNHDAARAGQVSLGYCLQEQQQWAAAAAAFRDAVDQRGVTNDLPRLYYEQAWSWREAGRTNDALQVFHTLADRFPTDALAAEANFHLAEIRYAEAALPDVAADRQRSLLDEARGMYDKALAADRDHHLADKVHYRIGWTWWLQANYGEAATAFDKVKDANPHSELLADALFQAGQAYAKAGQTDKAVERYRTLLDDKAFAAFPYRADAYAAIGDCLIVQGKPEEAATWLETANRDGGDTPAAAETAFLLGRARYDQQQYDEALKHFEAATTRSHGDVAARAQFYIGQVRQAQQDFSQALMAYLRVQALYPTSAEWVAAATCEAGKCQEVLGDRAEARKAYQAVIEHHKGTTWAALAEERMAALPADK